MRTRLKLALSHGLAMKLLVVPMHAKDIRGSGGTAPRVLNRGTRFT
jgi:hypothetical protein